MKRRLQDELKQSAPIPTLAEEVYLEIQRTSQVAGRWIAQALKPAGLTESQFNVLRILRGSRPNGLASSRIAERMVRHDPDLTRLLDRLEAGGLVEKSRDMRDRRVVNARITEAGLRVVESASEAARLRLQTALQPLGPRKLGTLADLLELVRASADTEAPSSATTRAITRTPTRRESQRRGPGHEPTGRGGRSRAAGTTKRRNTG
jgi:DNA-binding MarR family transcriptional regulator